MVVLTLIKKRRRGIHYTSGFAFRHVSNTTYDLIGECRLSMGNVSIEYEECVGWVWELCHLSMGSMSIEYGECVDWV